MFIAQDIIKPQQGLFGGLSEPNFMPSRLFDQDELGMQTPNKVLFRYTGETI